MLTVRVQQVREMQRDGDALAIALEAAIDSIIDLVGSSQRDTTLDCNLPPNMNSHRQVALARVLRDYLH